MGSHRHTGTRTHTRTPAAREYVPACPDGAPCLPAYLLVDMNSRIFRWWPRGHFREAMRAAAHQRAAAAT
eukprot:5568912-Prymnesium_polylepis.1